MVLTLKHVAGPAPAGSERITALEHEIVVEPVKDLAVVVGRVAHHAPRVQIDPVSLAGGKADEGGHRARSLVVIEPDPEGAEGGIAVGNGEVRVNLRRDGGCDGKEGKQSEGEGVHVG